MPITNRRRPGFVNTGKETTLKAAVMRNTLLNNPKTQRALLRYVYSLNDQMRKGKMTEPDALKNLEMFDLALRKFSRDMHTQINQKFIPKIPQLDQTDLNLYINMSTALLNPLSYASQLMNNTQAALIESLDNETAQNIATNQLNEQEVNDAAEHMLTETLQEAEKQPAVAEGKGLAHEAIATLAKATPLVSAVVAIEEHAGAGANTAVEHAFNKYTGGASDFTKIAEHAVEHEFKSLKQELKPGKGSLKDEER